MFEKRNKGNPLAKAAATLAVIKIIPFKKALLGIAAAAGAVYAFRRLSATR